MNHNHNNNMKNRQRGRNGGKPRPGGGGGGGGGGGRNPNFDGGNNRPRGNAQQLMEKFLAMARDASSAGDRVLAENYFQHADHYYRVLNARFEQQNGQGGNQPHNNNPQNQQGQPFNSQQGRPQNQSGDDNRGNQMDRGNYHQGYEGPGNQTPQQPGNYTQPETAPQPQPQQQPQNASQGEAEIGLPPGILGIAPQVPGGSETEEAAEGDDRRPQQVRRRRGPRDRADAAGE